MKIDIVSYSSIMGVTLGMLPLQGQIVNVI
jgi:hypothetical protein